MPRRSNVNPTGMVCLLVANILLGIFIDCVYTIQSNPLKWNDYFGLIMGNALLVALPILGLFLEFRKPRELRFTSEFWTGKKTSKIPSESQLIKQDAGCLLAAISSLGYLAVIAFIIFALIKLVKWVWYF